jgi:hypothetical protein
VKLATEHLVLVEVEAGELIRVGAPPRLEFVDWRYGPKSALTRRRPGFWARLLSGLPAPPVGGYDPYKGFEGAVRSEPWFASPFLDQASLLTYLFSQVPLARRCPSCSAPLAINPWNFQTLKVVAGKALPRLLAYCALCETEVALSLSDARAALRIGLGLVTPPDRIRRVAASVASELQAMGGASPFLGALASAGASVGDLDVPSRTGLIMTLDELAEGEALESEWQRAEEMAAIMDGELTQIPGFETFRRKILEQDP